jgi:hypothetical protein
MPLADDSGLTLNIFTADAGSASQHAPDLLASWAASGPPPGLQARVMTLEEQTQ